MTVLSDAGVRIPDRRFACARTHAHRLSEEHEERETSVVEEDYA